LSTLPSTNDKLEASTQAASVNRGSWRGVVNWRVWSIGLRGTLRAKEHEVVNLIVSQVNGCLASMRSHSL